MQNNEYLSDDEDDFLELSMEQKLFLLKSRGQLRIEQLIEYEEREKTVPLPPPRNPRLQFTSVILLMYSIERNDIQEVERLLKLKNVDINLQNDYGKTALHECCITNKIEFLALLIYYGADVNIGDNDLWTPLHSAAFFGHNDVARILIDEGANLLAINDENDIPLKVCYTKQIHSIIKGAMITKQISQERIEEVIKSGEKQMLDDLKFLHSQGQSLEQILPNKSTYLHIACANGYYDVAAFLLRVGVSVSSFDGDFWMPIHIAAFFDYPRLIELLVSYKADINQKTKSEETAYDLCGRLETRQLISKIERKDVKKKRSAYGVRDSRRQARKTKVEAIKNFEADEVGARTSVRRSSFREKNGEAMAKFDAKRENLALRDGKMDSSDGYQSEDIENEEMPTFKDKYDAKKQVLNQNERSTLLVQLNPSSQKLEEVDVKLTKDADDISKKNSFSKKIRSSIRKLRKQTSDEDIKKLSLKENGLVTGDDHNKRNSCCAIC